LVAKGTLVLVGGPNKGLWLGPLAGMLNVVILSRFVSQRLLPFLAHLNKDDLMALRGFLVAGKVAPVIDRTFPLGDVPGAIRYLEGGHARGKVVITMEQPVG
jgi:NADPH:quinone reductase-like Zn-dependent oxidoreductase